MAQPAITAGSAVGGFGSSLVAYGYAMSGTSLTACAALSYATGLVTTSIFKGAQYQSITAILTPVALTLGTVAITASDVWVTAGPRHVNSAAGIVKAFIAGGLAIASSDGIITTSSQNSYWDFM